MAVVSVDVDRLRQVICDLEAARIDASGAATDLQAKLSEAGVWTYALSNWTYGAGIMWMETTVMWLRRRLEYAELLQQVTVGGLSVVSFDDSVFDVIDVADVKSDVDAAIKAVNMGDAKALAAILEKYQVTSGNPSVTYSDPFFGKALALSVDPQKLAGLLLGLDQDPGVDLAWYDWLLWELGGSLSVGARSMSYTQLLDFTTRWGNIRNEFPQGEAGPTPVPPGGEPPTGWGWSLPSMGAYVEALSLVIGRGDWPDGFLTGMVSSYSQQEDGKGVDYWLVNGWQVKDPGSIDPVTGLSVVVCDPMWGVLSAAVMNPEWFLSQYENGETRDVSFISSGRNDPTHQFDTSTGVVSAVLDDVFHRGFDQGSYAALLAAITTGDAYLLSQGRDPVMIVQTQTIARGMLLEDYLAPQMPLWLHAALDVISMLPGVDVAADGVNAFLYWLEGDTGNAVFSAGAVMVPGVVDAVKKGEKWAVELSKVLDGMGETLRPAKYMDELAVLGERYTIDHVVMVTKTRDGKLVWLEIGHLRPGDESVKAGYQHILEHVDHFAAQGVPETEIPVYVMTALSEGTPITTQGSTRTVYEFMWHGETRRVAIDVGSDGFIVGANPVHRPR